MRSALETLPWVRDVKVDFGNKRAVVTVVADKCDEKALLKALEKEGYQGKVMKKAAKK